MTCVNGIFWCPGPSAAEHKCEKCQKMKIQHNTPKTIGGPDPASKNKVSTSGLPGLGQVKPRVAPRRLGDK